MKNPLDNPLVLSLRSVLFLALGTIGAIGAASAQCPVPDHLDGGPCCTTAMEKLPKFPDVLQDSLEICWRACAIEFVGPCRAQWTNLKGIQNGDCGYRQVRLDLFNPPPVLIWTGVMRLLYSRTWVENNPAGTPLQVWRFLVNGDLRPTPAAGPAPCPLPPCAPAFNNRVRFTGYVDYAQSCATGGFEVAWMLSHVCDFIDHRMGFPRGGAFHPDRSYTFVGPGAGFMPAPVIPTEGTPGSPFEAVRRLTSTGPIVCEFEERFNHVLTPLQQFCQCGPTTANPQWMLGNLGGNGACGTTIGTPGGPFLPGFLSMGIGQWTIPGTYPGVEYLRWNAGGYDYFDPCAGILQPEVFYGVTTIGGYPAVQLNTVGPGLPLPLTFIDQANSITPGGALLMNIPFISSHILNLNH